MGQKNTLVKCIENDNEKNRLLVTQAYCGQWYKMDDASKKTWSVVEDMAGSPLSTDSIDKYDKAFSKVSGCVLSYKRG